MGKARGNPSYGMSVGDGTEEGWDHGRRICGWRVWLRVGVSTGHQLIKQRKHVVQHVILVDAGQQLLHQLHVFDAPLHKLAHVTYEAKSQVTRTAQVRLRARSYATKLLRNKAPASQHPQKL